MRDFIKKNFKFITKVIRSIKIKRKIRYDYHSFKNNWLYSRKTKEKIGYGIILEAHALEKGMTNLSPRHFGSSKVNKIINYLEDYHYNNWDTDYAYNLGVSVLIEYCNFYERNNWQDKEEYKRTKEYIKNKKTDVLSGAHIIYKNEFISDTSIDYKKFLESRHSFRQYLKKKISESDFKKCVEMSLLSPSACNRQMCKIYYAKSDNIKKSIMKFCHGLTNFDNESVNLFIITYDVSSLCDVGEINQGMFNAGLFAMNFVNSMHSLGIGSCFLQYNVLKEEDRKMKSILTIPDNEQVAVVIAAGYYPDKSVITYSSRKPIEEVYRQI